MPMKASRSKDSGKIAINTKKPIPGIKDMTTPARPNIPRSPIKAGVPDFLKYAAVPARKKLSSIITIPMKPVKSLSRISANAASALSAAVREPTPPLRIPTQLSDKANNGR